MIKERIKEGFQTARAKEKKIRQTYLLPLFLIDVVKIIEELVATTNLTIRKNREEIGSKRLAY